MKFSRARPNQKCARYVGQEPCQEPALVLVYCVNDEEPIPLCEQCYDACRKEFAKNWPALESMEE